MSILRASKSYDLLKSTRKILIEEVWAMLEMKIKCFLIQSWTKNCKQTHEIKIHFFLTTEKCII